MLERSMLVAHSNNWEDLDIHTIDLLLVLHVISSPLSPVRERAL